MHELDLLQAAGHGVLQEDRGVGQLQGDVPAGPRPLRPRPGPLGLRAAGAPDARHPRGGGGGGRGLGGGAVQRGRGELRRLDVLQPPRHAVLPEEREVGGLLALVRPGRPSRRLRRGALGLRAAGAPHPSQARASVALLLGPLDVLRRRGGADPVPDGRAPEHLRLRRLGGLQRPRLRPWRRLRRHADREHLVREGPVGLLAEHAGLCQGLARRLLHGPVQVLRLDREGRPGLHVPSRAPEAARRRHPSQRAVVYAQQQVGVCRDTGPHRGLQPGRHAPLLPPQRPRHQRHRPVSMRDARLPDLQRRGWLHQ
mmetsp:Transcript_69395/g.184441  ORF Transcript_69395/g.184441 Transcript_69395/m.184441 type:complete len:312 (+) Transcript_69395:829-1764(+)